MAAGGTGIVSVVSNMAPQRMARLAELCAKGELAAARQEHFALMPLMSAAFIESNPIPAKAALAMMRKTESTVRLPLVPLDEKHLPTLRSALQAAGVDA
jgi:4-hydroxy-tetrahydrodipicolinate synthase